MTGKVCACGRGGQLRVRKCCRKCENERVNRWRRKNPTYHREYGRRHMAEIIVRTRKAYRANPEIAKERTRRSRYLKIYGITVDQYDTMLAQQGGVCKLCREGPKNEKSRLHVDHCHATGRVRGLLCYLCNKQRVGRARDHEYELYQRIVDYLRSDFD